RSLANKNNPKRKKKNGQSRNLKIDFLFALLFSVVVRHVKMKVPLPVLILLASVALLAFARAAPTWETMYVDSLSNSSVRAFAQNYTATAHLAGTEEDYQSALYTQAQVLPPF
ncbi:hypothetical protein GR268_45945, partial [Rhizobium leguminosarum]|nr:hypothetical protein [Rhizobium leguminosarum]